MDETRWATALESVKKYTFKIATPDGSGTGFMLTAPNAQSICGVATAYHVVAHSHQWEEPIRLTHAGNGASTVLHTAERYIFANPEKDLAVVVCQNETFELPKHDPVLFPEDKHIKPGIQIGWAGYPAVAPNDFSFFSGDVSCFLQKELAYLGDSGDALRISASISSKPRDKIRGFHILPAATRCAVTALTNRSA